MSDVNEKILDMWLEETQSPDVNLDTIPQPSELSPEERHRMNMVSGKTLGQLTEVKTPESPPTDKKEEEKLKEEPPEETKPEEKPTEAPEAKPEGDPPPADDKPPEETKPEESTPPEEKKDDTPPKKPTLDLDESIFEPQATEDQTTEDEDPNKALLDQVVSEGSLTKEEELAVDFWKFAEQHDPGKYQGGTEKLLRYIQSHRKAAERFRNEDPDTPLEENERYIQWVDQNKPKIAASEAQYLREQKIRDEVARETEAKFNEKFKAIEQENKKKELQAKVDQNVQSVADSMESFLRDAGKESEAVNAMLEFIDEHGSTPETVEKLQQEFPEQGRILAGHYYTAEQLSRRWIEFRAGLSQLQPENQADMVLISKLQSFEQDIKASDKLRTRNGKEFATFNEYQQMDEETRAKHWRLTDSQFLRALTIDVMNSATRDIDKSAEQSKKMYGKTQAEAWRERNSKRETDPKKEDTPPKKDPPQEEEEIPSAMESPRSSANNPQKTNPNYDILGDIL